MRDQGSRFRVKRLAHLEIANREEMISILEEALVCQVGILQEDQPFVLPMAFVLNAENLWVHGAKGSRLMQYLVSGSRVCVSVTLLDGLVLARSAFSHSMNYRSVCVFGKGTSVEGREEKLRVLKALSDKYVPGRWEKVRFPSEEELQATLVVGIPIESISGKKRSGPPDDLDKDLDFPVWAGVIPFETIRKEPIPDKQRTRVN